MNLFAVIVTYNPKRWIDKCLGSLGKSSSALKIIVIDNNSNDGSQDYIREKYPEINLIQSTENLGFGRANNIGITIAYQANADYVFLLNQDVWIEPDTIEKLINAHQKELEFGILSPMHLNGKGDALDYNFSNFINPSKCQNIYSDVFLNMVKDKIYEVEFVNAAAWLLSKKCIETIGGFNPSFFHYAEDDNYVQRLKYHNLKIGVVPNTVIYHDRDTREKNIFFEDLKIIYRRKVIFKVSNPFYEYSFYDEYKKLFRIIIKSIFSLNIKQIKESCLKIMILKGLNKTLVIMNKSESKKSQTSFLN